MSYRTLPKPNCTKHGKWFYQPCPTCAEKREAKATRPSRWPLKISISVRLGRG